MECAPDTDELSLLSWSGPGPGLLLGTVRACCGSCRSGGVVLRARSPCALSLMDLMMDPTSITSLHVCTIQRPAGHIAALCQPSQRHA